MEGTPLLGWVLIVSGLSSVALLVTVGAVFAWQQRREAMASRLWGRRILMAYDEERQRIAKELHDDIVQRLYLARLTLARNEDAAGDMVDELMGDVRALARGLHPPALEDRNLPEALKSLAEAFEQTGPPPIEVKVTTDRPIPTAPALALYRVAQEAVSNARRHAKATVVRITLAADGDTATLTITDDGVGGVVAVSTAASLGMRSMHERMAVFDGSLEVKSEAGAGTTIVARVPVK